MSEYKNIVITISGDPATGKGTLVRELKKCYEAEGFEVEVITAGDIFREVSYSEYMKMFPNAVNPSQEEIQSNPAFAEKLKEIDLNLDKLIAEKGKRINSKPQPGKVFIFDSRVAFNFVKSFSVMVTASPKTAGERAHKDPKRKPQERGSSPEESIRNTESRREAEIGRYLELYKIYIKDPKYFHMIIDTDDVELEEVPYIAKVIKKCQEREAKGESYGKRWASPKTFYPTQDVSQTDPCYIWENIDKTNTQYPPYIKTHELQIIYPEAQITYKTQQIGNWKRIGYRISEFAQKMLEEDFDPNAAVDATTRGKSVYKFLGQGHHRVFGSIKAGIPLVTYIITDDMEEETIPLFMQNYIHSHEGIIQPDGTPFYYSEYPEVEQQYNNHDTQDDDGR